MIIDFHAHCFTDKIASAAMSSLSARTGGFRHFSDGTLDGLKRSLAVAGVDGAVVLNIATNPLKASVVNDYAAAINDPANHIYAFGSVHPDSPDVLEELERIKSLGLKGVKFQPAFQGFRAEEERMIPIYRQINKLGLITTFHCGEDLGFEDCYINPESLAHAMRYFTDVPVIAAHFGGYMLWRDVEKYLLNTSVYLDTSFSYSRLPMPIARKIASSFGPKRILYGTDTPWTDMELELGFVRSIGFDEAGLDDVLGGNAMRLLG